MFPLIRTLTKYIFRNKPYYLNRLYLHKDKIPIRVGGRDIQNLFTEKTE